MNEKLQIYFFSPKFISFNVNDIIAAVSWSIRVLADETDYTIQILVQEVLVIIAGNFTFVDRFVDFWSSIKIKFAYDILVTLEFLI